MNASVNYLKQDHEEISHSLLEFEEMIDWDDINYDLNYRDFLYVFHKIVSLLQQHEKKEKLLLNGINNNYYMKIPINNIILDQRRIQGHIKVINESISSKNPNSIKLALDNDGRMFISNIKEHIFKEEKIFDRLLFLHLVH